MKKNCLTFIISFYLLFGIIACSPNGNNIAEKVCNCQEELLSKKNFTRAEIESQADSCREYYITKYLVLEKKELKFDFERAEPLISESLNRIQAVYDKQLNALGDEVNELFKGVAEQKYISPQTMNHVEDSLLSIVCKKYNLSTNHPVIDEAFNLEIVQNTYENIIQKFRSQPSYVMDLTQMIYSAGYVNEYKLRTNSSITVDDNDNVLFYVVLPADYNRTFEIPPFSFDALQNSGDKLTLGLFGISSMARLRNSFQENTENRVVLNNIYLLSLDKRPVVYGKIIDKENGTYKLFDSETKRTSSQVNIWSFEVFSADNIKVETSVIIDRIKNSEILKEKQGSVVLLSGNYKGYNQMSYSTSFSNIPINQGLYFDNCEIIGIYETNFFFDNVKKNIWNEYIKYCNSSQVNVQNSSNI